MTIVLRAGSATDPGRVRPVNQDRVLILDNRLYAVADGMGGHRGGEVAAQLTIEELPRAITLPDRSESGPLTSDELVAAIERANRHVLDVADSDPELHGMGTTVTALAPVASADGDILLAVFNVGDSRTYWLRNGELSQLTDDHNMVAELVRDGRITVDEARHHRQRSVLTRALGVEPDIDVDVIEILAARGDRYVLCSDGLYSEIADEVIGSTLRRIADPGEAARELVRMAVQQGGRDNVSVVVVDVVDDDGAASRASATLDPSAPHGSKSETEEADSAMTNRTGVRSSNMKQPRRPRPLNLRVLIFLAALAALAGAVVWTVRNSPPPEVPHTPTTLELTTAPTGSTPPTVATGTPASGPTAATTATTAETATAVSRTTVVNAAVAAVTVPPDPFGPETRPPATGRPRPTTRASTATTTAPKA